MTLRCIHIGLLAVLLLVNAGCNTSVTNIANFNEWLNDPKNGCIVSKTIAGIDVTVKYLPPAYGALRALERANDGRSGIDTVMSEQNKTTTFLMSLGVNKEIQEERGKSSIMYEGVEDHKAFEERLLSMNFFMERYCSLYVDGIAHQAVIATTENLYELSDSRNFMIIFVSDKSENITDGRECTFIYEDPFFKMGKVQFNFSGESLAKARNIKID